MWTHRTMIGPAAVVEAARAACAGLAGPGGSGMFQAACSPTGELPATHYISSGHIEDTFANLLPLTSVDAEGVASTRPGDAVTTAALAAQQGLPFTEAQIAGLYAAVDVSEQDAEAALRRLGLMFVQSSENEI